jgi:hypothetical protein
MYSPSNVVPLIRHQAEPEVEDPCAQTILGKLCRDDFELWVCRSAGGVLSLRWWRWREDAEHFDPMEDGGLTLDPSELMPLAELLTSVGARLAEKG